MIDYYYDAVIIGGGHNGLVCAAYLAKAGKDVCVIERRPVIGGAACTEQVWPGFKINPCAYVISLFQQEIIDYLDLKNNGLKILPRQPSSYTPDLQGPGLVLGSPVKGADCKSISFYSERDADNYDEYQALLTRIAERLEPIIATAAPNLFADKGRWYRLKEILKLVRLATQVKKFGNNALDAVELLTGDAVTILNRYFKSDILKATLATDAVIGSFTSPYNPGSAYVLMHHVMGDIGGARGVWGYVQGGMGQLSQSILNAAKNFPGVLDVKLNTSVKKINTSMWLTPQGGREAVGVTLQNGKMIGSSVVVSSIDPHNTFRTLLTKKVLEDDFLALVDRIDYSSASAKLNLALDGLPRFINQPNEEIYNGTIHISPDLEYIEEAYHAARMGHPSEKPLLEITIPSAVDETLAPDGKHVMSIFVQYAPYKLRAGSWDDQQFREGFVEKCLTQLETYAPGIRKLILHQQFISPLDLEREFGLTGGNIFQGAMTFSQMHMLRPMIGWADHRTPVQNLYMCGAACHPGGGVMGVCGKNAAKVILSDL